MGKEMERTTVRDNIMDSIFKFVSSDEGGAFCPRYVAGGEITLPVTDDEGNEFYANIIVKIPRGRRSEGTYIPYDGYAAADEYDEELEAKRKEKETKEKAKATKEAEKKRKQEAKKTIKKLNKDGLDKMIHEEGD